MRTLEPRALWRPEHIPIPDRVEAGVRLLDSEIPDWWQRINLDRLDIACCFRCVVGQLYGDYDDGVETLELDLFGYKTVDALGFESSSYDDDRRLTVVWRNRIEARRATTGAGA